MTHLERDDTELDPPLLGAVHELRAPVATRSEARASLNAALVAASAASRNGATPGVSPVRDTRVPPPPAPTPRPVRWFTRRRALRVSPVGLLAAASLLVAVTASVTATMMRDSASASTSVLPTSTSAVRVVRFTLSAPRARQVSLVGDFNGWDASATTLQQHDGMWTVVIPVTPGRHQYGFVIDGTEWIADPEAARTSDADFGTPNSVVFVGS